VSAPSYYTLLSLGAPIGADPAAQAGIVRPLSKLVATRQAPRRSYRALTVPAASFRAPVRGTTRTMPTLSLRQEGHQFGASRGKDRRRPSERQADVHAEPGRNAELETQIAALWELVEAERRRADASEHRTDQLNHLIDRLALRSPEHLRTAAPKAGPPAPAGADGLLSCVDDAPRPLDSLPGLWPDLWRIMSFWEAAAFFAIIGLVAMLVLALV
jgi:hypothetical protein